jgi:hypothetical protein
MSTVGQLILVHAVIGFMVVFCLANIRGRMAHLTYEARMATFLRHFLMPGKLASREVWVRQQKLISWIGLFFAGVIYVLVMIQILSDLS